MAIAHVQDATGAALSGSSPTHVSTFGAATTVGNVVTCIATTNDTSGQSGGSMSGGGVGTWIQLQLANTVHDSEFWYGFVTSPGATTVTFTDGHGNSDPAGNVQEWSGISSGSPVSTSGKLSGTSNSTTITSVALAVTTGQLIIVGGYPVNGIASPYASNASSTPTSGWSAHQSGATGTATSFNVLAWMIATGSGTDHATWTAASSTTYDNVGAVFNPAGSTPVLPVIPFNRVAVIRASTR